MQPFLIYSLLFLGSFFYTVLLTFRLIPILRAKKLGQSILEIGPVWHKSKEGTPTMGGAVFASGILLFSLIGCLFLEKNAALPLSLVLLFALLNGICGVIDDLQKFKNKKNQGLLPWQKIILQASFAFLFLSLWESRVSSSLPLFLPFTSLFLKIGFASYFVLLLLLIGMVNCTNLSDGIDGLCASCVFIIGVFFSVEGVLLQNTALSLLGITVTASMLAFLLFNRHPARIFMGDTGSLFLGATVVGGSFLLGKPLAALVFGFPFVLEGASVILQVLVYKRTKRRLFLMAPLHHHLEKRGWSENKIVYAFLFTTLAFCLIAHFA